MDGDKDGILQKSKVKVSLGTPDVIVIGTDEDIILDFYDVVFLTSTLWPTDRITLGLDEGTELSSSYGSFNVPNEGNPYGSLLGDRLE